MFVFPAKFSLTMMAVAAAGMATNAKSTAKIWSMYDVRKAIFFLLLSDSALSFAGATVFFAINAVFFVLDYSSRFLCYGYFLAIYVPQLLGTCITALIAAFRYYGLKKAQKNEVLKESTMYYALAAVLGSAVAYEAVSVGAHHALGLSLAMTFESCFRGTESVKLPPSGSLTVSVPLFVIPVVSLVYDALIVRTIKTALSSTAAKKNAEDQCRISVRATASSAFTFLPYLVLGMITNLSTDNIFVGAVIIQVSAAVLVVLRAPLTMMITFQDTVDRANKSKKAAEQVAETDAAEKGEERTVEVSTEGGSSRVERY